jgi:hypothetical protein
MHKAEQLLENLRDKFGLHRVRTEGTPILYALMRTYDRNTEEFCERWSTVATDDSATTALADGVREVMSRIAEGSKDAEVPEQVPQVQAIALVSYGDVLEVEGDVPKPEGWTPYVMGKVEKLDPFAEPTGDKVSARMVSLMSPEGYAHEMTVVHNGNEVMRQVNTGEIYDDVNDMSDAGDDEMKVGGPMHEKMREGLATALLMTMTAQKTGSTDPFDITLTAIEVDFPYANQVVRALVHAMIEQVDFESFPKDMLTRWLTFARESLTEMDDNERERNADDLRRLLFGDDED